MDARSVEELLSQLARAQDSETIRNITSTLNTQVYASPECIPALVQVISTSTMFEVRQLAAVELRKRVSKWWLKVDESARGPIRAQLLQVVLSEQHNLVRHAIARSISSIARIDIAENKWPELLTFLNQASSSGTVAHREVGIYCIYTLFEVIAEFLMNQTAHLFELFSKTIVDPESQEVRATTVLALGKLAEFIDPEDKDNINAFKQMIPAMVNVLEASLKENDDKNAREIFEVIENLFMLDTPFLSDHLAELIRFLLTVASSHELDDSLRELALNSLMWGSIYKQSKIKSLKLVAPIIESIIPIGTEEDPEDVDDDSPSRTAFKVMNALASNMPPQQIVPIMMPIVVNYMQNQSAGHRKAAMMSVAVIIEGCAEYISTMLKEILPIVCAGLQDPEMIVRRAACMALSCLAEELPVEMAEHHQAIMPLVFNLLNDTNPEITKHACNALDPMLDGLEGEVLQYLPMLMEKLIWLLDNAQQTDTKATALGAIGSAAHSASEGFQPYFGEVMPRIRNFMSATNGSDEALLRGVATDTAGAIAEAVGAEMFRPHTQDFMNLAIEQLTLDSPRLRECSYAFFSVIAGVFGEEFAPFLPTIMPAILHSCKAEESNEPNLETEIDLTVGDDEDDDIDEDDLSGLNFNSAIADEKEFACDALGELFENTRSHFLPYVDESLQALVEATGHLFDGVRKASLGSLFSYIKTFYSLSSNSDWVQGLPVSYPVHENVQKILQLAIPTVLTMWSDEDDRMVAVQICKELIQALKLMGPCVVADHVQDISDHILEIFEKRSTCQETYDVEDVVDEDEEAESESLLIAAAADLVAALCETIGQGYMSFFNVFLPLITKYYKSTKGPGERLMATGCLGECVGGIKSGVTPHTEMLLQLFLKAAGDEEETVRSNAAFALGVLVKNTETDLSQQYPTILSVLHPLFENQNLPGTTDNASGAVARLIIAHPNAVPLDQVLPVFLNALPLKSDYAENEPVFECLFHLFRANNPFVMGHIPQFLPIFSSVLSNEEQLGDATRAQLIELIRALNAQSSELNLASTELGRFL
ncbi:armadillo-type protein [Phascolomyces articulosus]|uniref:Armadillo-type protein n=1 Tax=Phascolomyces articulosus TaxID=60185 RepID=A0AAD5P946_9FUNG|nr:armadillo-type protein [Phascolomyces articulosus]KAI9245389.1 armadillo-type protein [Phascolomyces articulosus]